MPPELDTADRVAALTATAGGDQGATDGYPKRFPPDADDPDADDPAEPVMPAPPFPTFTSKPSLPHQSPGVGFESGRDSRAR